MAASPTPALLLPSLTQPPTCNAEPPSSSSSFSPPPASQPPAAAPSRPAVGSPPESSPTPPLQPSASPPAPALYPSAPAASPPDISPSAPPPSPTIIKPPTFYYTSPPPPSHLHPAVPPPTPPSPVPFTSPPLRPPPPRTPPPPSHTSPPAVPSPATSSSPPALPSAAPVRPNPPNPPSTSHNAKDLVVQRSSSGGSRLATGTVATISVFSGLLMLTFIVAAVWFVKKRKKPFEGGGRRGVLLMASPAASTNSHASNVSNSRSRSPSYPFVRNTSGSSSLPYSPSEPGLGNGRLWFTLDDLSTITNGFAAQNLLGEGGFGSVYKGRLQDGRQVAVKKLKMGAKQGEKEFKAEVETISRVHHRHLVSLVGYCTADDDRLLVYDYVPNKTLYHHLHGKGTMLMDWATRVKVAAGAARGIAYLHEDCHPRIIHRDIKSSNILLDDNFEAKVSDFGLARSALDSNTHVTTRVMGTFGYLAPEYASSGKLTEKSDVYSFGVVLLELITGRKPVDTSQPLGDESLVEWARPSLIQALETRDFGKLPDPRLGKNYVNDEMFRMIEAAAACVRHSAAMRPKMSQVVRALDGLAEIDITNGVRPGQSEIFSSPPESAEIRMFQMREFGNLDCGNERTRSSWINRTDL